MKIFRITFVFLFCSIPAFYCTQLVAGVTEQPSISAESARIFIANHTNQNIQFAIEGANTEWTIFNLAPRTQDTYTAEGETWLNISFNNGSQITYGVDMSTRHAFQYRNDGKVDLFELPPK